LKFNPAERINLLNVLPKDASASTLKILRDLQLSLSFTEEEHKRFFIISKLPNGQKYEDLNPDTIGVLTDVPIGEKAKDIIVDALKEWDKKDQLKFKFSIFREILEKNKQDTLLDLYERFVDGKKTPEDLADESAAVKMKEVNAAVPLPAGAPQKIP
jgi:hypothetical protein